MKTSRLQLRKEINPRRTFNVHKNNKETVLRTQTKEETGTEEELETRNIRCSETKTSTLRLMPIHLPLYDQYGGTQHFPLWAEKSSLVNHLHVHDNPLKFCVVSTPPIHFVSVKAQR